jgi:hypothetical protein
MNDINFVEVDPDNFKDICPKCGGKKFLDVSI